jgi:hypothetical protein
MAKLILREQMAEAAVVEEQEARRALKASVVAGQQMQELEALAVAEQLLQEPEVGSEWMALQERAAELVVLREQVELPAQKPRVLPGMVEPDFAAAPQLEVLVLLLQNSATRLSALHL